MNICIPDHVNIYFSASSGLSKASPIFWEVITAVLKTGWNWQRFIWGCLWEKDNYLVCPQEVWYCRERLSKRDQRSTHRSTSEGFVDPRYYQLSELTGYTYFTRQSTCHVLTAFGFTYEPKFLHEAPWAPRCFTSLDEVLSLNRRWMQSAKLIWGIFFCALTKATKLVLVSIADDRSLGCSVCPGVRPPAADSRGFVQVSKLCIAEASVP